MGFCTKFYDVFRAFWRSGGKWGSFQQAVEKCCGKFFLYDALYMKIDFTIIICPILSILIYRYYFIDYNSKKLNVKVCAIFEFKRTNVRYGAILHFFLFLPNGESPYVVHLFLTKKFTVQLHLIYQSLTALK